MRSRSDNGWTHLEHSVGRDAYKLESIEGRSKIGFIAYVWLVFYVLAVTHSLLSPRFWPTVITAQAEEPALPSVD
jgi:hypothetical protein